MLRNKLLVLLILCMALFSKSGFAKTIRCTFSDNLRAIHHCVIPPQKSIS